MSNIEEPNHLSEYFFKSINSNNKINLKFFQEYHQSIGGDSSNFFEAMTSIDEHGLNFLYYVKLERKESLINEIFKEYKTELKKVKPQKWDFIYFEEHDFFHDKLKNFYGEEYYNQISNNLDPSHVPFFHPKHLQEFFKENKLDNFFKKSSIMETFNAPSFYSSSSGSWLFLHLFKNQPESYKKTLSKADTSLHYNIFTKNVFSKTLKNKSQLIIPCGSYGLNLPTTYELDNFIFKPFGIQEGNKILHDFLQINHNKLIKLIKENNTNYEEYKINRSSDTFLNSTLDIGINSQQLFDFMTHEKINLKLLMPILVPYLNKDSELLSHCIINNLIDKEDLLFNIKKSDYLKQDEFIVLNEQLPKNTKHSKSPKI